MARRGLRKKSVEGQQNQQKTKASLNGGTQTLGLGVLAGCSAALAIAAILIYLPITHHPFIDFDDGVYVTENPHIQAGIDFATVKWALTSLYAANWHPATWLVHAANYQMYGADAGGHHTTSLLFHAANTALVFLLLALMTQATGRSFFVAAVFALHPLNVESVAWAAELKNVVSTFFFLLTLIAYFYYAKKADIGRYLLVVMLFVLALMAKPMAITLPFVLLLMDYWPLQRDRTMSATPEPPAKLWQRWARLVLEKVPLLLLSAGSALITIRGQQSGHATEAIHVSLLLRVENAIVSYATYIVKLFLPTDLAPFYPFPEKGITASVVLGSTVLLLAIIALVFLLGRTRRYLWTGWLWFLGTLVPVIGLMQVGAQARADRYMYLPMLGLLVMLAWGYAEFAQRQRWSLALRTVPAALFLVMLSVLTAQQIAHWNSILELWSYTLRVTKDNIPAEHNLSAELMNDGKLEEAYPHVLRVIELDPKDGGAHVNLGVIFMTRGKFSEAAAQFEQVMQTEKDPKVLLPSYVNAAAVDVRLGEFDKAEAAYRKALEIDPGNAQVQQGLQIVQRAKSAATSTSAAKPAQ